jgi:flotillin
MPEIPHAVEIWIFVALAVMVILFLISGMARIYRKAGPHEALIVYGLGGTRVVKGHGTMVLPMVQICRELSLELMSFDVAPQQDLYTKQGVAVTVEAVAQIKVKSDTESILTASEQFLTKTDDERQGLIRLVMEGHLRGIIGQLTVEEIVKQPEMVSDRMRSTCADDMNKMGLEVISPSKKFATRTSTSPTWGVPTSRASNAMRMLPRPKRIATPRSGGRWRRGNRR